MAPSGTLSGMTGFARAEGARGALAWAWEVKSVNGRGLDVRFRTPPGFDALEAKARERAQKRFARGSVSANLQLHRDAAAARVRVNADQLKAYIAAARPFVAEGAVAPPALDGLMALRGVIETDDGEIDADERAALEVDMLASFEMALEALEGARREEGAALAPVLAGAVDRIEALAGQAGSVAAAQPDAIRDRLRAKLAELLDGAVPEERLATEAAVLAVKADVREELDRLAAHVASARELLAASEPSGRRLDFLAQEFNREANTLCSKSPDTELTRIGLELKAVIDQFREQAQNVE